MQLDGKSIDQFEYDLPGAPCGYVVKNGYCAYPEKVRELFPDDTDLVDMQAEGYVGVSLRGRDGDAVGVLCVLSRRKLKLPPKIREVFEIIAVKAAAEIMHKQEEDKLRHKEAEYESLYSMLRLMCDNMPDMMWAKDTDKHYIFANKALCDNLLHAKDTDEPVGKADMFFAERERNTHPEDPEWHTFGEICRDSDAVALESGKAEQFDEFGNIRHKFLFLDVHKAPMFDDKGKVVGMVGSARDITERKRMEMALQEEQEHSRQIINTALDAFVSMDENGIITDWNPCAETLFGWPREEALGCLMSKIIIPEEFREAYEKGLKHYLATGEGPVINQQIEISALRRDGHTFPVELSVVSTRSNNTTRFNAFLRDISERTRAKKALEESSEQLRTSLIGTVVAVSRAVGARDPYTAGHQQRVSQLSRAIAREMGLDAERIDGLRMGASIHDIGKIYLPAEILSKPAKLTDIEYELTKSHAQVGYDILKDIAFPWPVADIAYQHHERLDGSGYPQGLKGDEICLEARIVAVADVVEAMSSHRPYRPALGIEVALEEITKYRGKYFDPAIVDTTLKLFREKNYNFESGTNK